MIDLTRFAETPHGVFGEITLPSGRKLYTVEQHWRNNAQNVSCIPAGIYALRKRVSPKVLRIAPRYPQAWEVTNVPGRTFIMVHPANRATELEGCISVGLSLTFLDGEWAVGSSQDAYGIFMAELAEAEEHVLRINWAHLGEWK